MEDFRNMEAIIICRPSSVPFLCCLSLLCVGDILVHASNCFFGFICGGIYANVALHHFIYRFNIHFIEIVSMSTSKSVLNLSIQLNNPIIFGVSEPSC